MGILNLEKRAFWKGVTSCLIIWRTAILEGNRLLLLDGKTESSKSFKFTVGILRASLATKFKYSIVIVTVSVNT